MAVILTSEVLGQAVGFEYTGPLEAWLKNEGYATSAAVLPDAWEPDSDGVLGGEVPEVTVTPTAAVLSATVNAVNQSGAGTVVFGTKDGVRTVVTLAAADTPAAAATKIDTALAGLADAAIVGGKLTVTSIATGTTAYVAVVGGTAAVLADLKVAVGDQAYGGDGRPTGASNLGVQADTPANDLTASLNREAPYFPTTPDRNSTIANDEANLTLLKFPNPDFDADLNDVDAEAPSDLVLDVTEGPEEGGTVVHITGLNLENVTSVTFDAVAGTDLDVSAVDDGVLAVTTPAGTAGPADVVLVDASGNATLVAGFTYLATP